MIDLTVYILCGCFILLNVIFIVVLKLLEYNLNKKFNELEDKYLYLEETVKQIEFNNYSDSDYNLLNSVNNINNYISTANDDEIESILEACADRVLIPNWFTKQDFEKLTKSDLTDNKWSNILDDSEYLISKTANLVLQWANELDDENTDNELDDEDDDAKDDNEDEDNEKDETDNEDDDKNTDNEDDN